MFPCPGRTVHGIFCPSGTVHCIHGLAPPQNPGEKSDQTSGQKSASNKGGVGGRGAGPGEVLMVVLAALVVVFFL